MRFIALAVLAAVATGCMGRTASGGSGSSDKPTYLYISVSPSGKPGDWKQYGLRCRGPGGEYSLGVRAPLPNTARSCRRLARVGAKAFEPVKQGASCLAIYGGPQKATVWGKVAGRNVEANFNRRDGCEIERWNKVGFLFPDVR